jgi:hypothetical protein
LVLAAVEVPMHLVAEIVQEVREELRLWELLVLLVVKVAGEALVALET